MACGCNNKKNVGAAANTKPAATQPANKQVQKLPLVSIDKKALSQSLAKKISKRQ
jgi:hypothetical protein